MRIGVIAPVWFPVPPTGYGGIEWIVSLLADGLVDAGHDVTLFASGDSHTRAWLAGVYETAPSEWIGHSWWELRHALAGIGQAKEFDVLHDHTGLLGLAVGGLVKTPFVHTVHGPLVGQPGEVYAQVCELVDNASVISISMNQRRPKPDLPWVANVPNALSLDLYPFHPQRGDYLAFVGRMTADKGAHRAIAVALELGLPLKMCGKCREPLEREYFRQYIEPHLSDKIEYLGEVTHGEKCELLAKARATLFPIDWEEPFGLVMIESMACGTPVIAPRRGAVPEVVDHGQTGIIVDDLAETATALEAADKLDPHKLRQRVEDRFSPQRMVYDYLAAYEAVIASTSGSGPIST